MEKPNYQKRIIHRLKIANGHLKKIIEMVEGERYCIDILQQSKAVQNALKEADSIILENHLKTCVVKHMKEGRTEIAIEEILKVVKNNP